MSRFKMPPRVAPSPAAGESGLQNAAARLRSSRDVQARLLEERRATAESNVAEGSAGEHSGHRASEIITAPSEQDGATGFAASASRPAVKADSLYRTAKRKTGCAVPLASDHGSTDSVYRRCRWLERGLCPQGPRQGGQGGAAELKGDADLEPLLNIAKLMRSVPASQLTVGEAMTVYLRHGTLAAMHSALGDPWQVLPKATVVGAFLAAIVTRLIEARLER